MDRDAVGQGKQRGDIIQKLIYVSILFKVSLGCFSSLQQKLYKVHDRFLQRADCLYLIYFMTQSSHYTG